MKEQGKERLSLSLGDIARYLGDQAFKFWKGHTRAEAEAKAEEYKRWGAIQATLPRIDTKERDEWLAHRQRELSTTPVIVELSPEPLLDVWAYSRARLEYFCQRQGELEDGERVMNLPVRGLGREALAKLGIQVDPYERETDGPDYTAILPQGYSFKPIPDSERWALVSNADGVGVVEVFYSSMPFGYGSGYGLESYTRLPYSEQPANA